MDYVADNVDSTDTTIVSVGDYDSAAGTDGGDSQGWAGAALAESGDCWWIYEESVGGNAGTFYGGPAANTRAARTGIVEKKRTWTRAARSRAPFVIWGAFSSCSPSARSRIRAGSVARG